MADTRSSPAALHQAIDGPAGVAVDEARLDSPAALVKLPASHTFMMNNRQVRAVVRDLLARAAA